MRRGINYIAPLTAAAALLSSFVRAVLTWRHRTVTSTRQAGRRHFFGGIATNCLNNSKSAPLSPTSSPFRTASSSPFNRLRRWLWVRGYGLWFLTCEPIACTHDEHLTALCIFRYFGSNGSKTIEGGGGWTDARAGGILPLHPLSGYYIAGYHFQPFSGVKIP